MNDLFLNKILDYYSLTKEEYNSLIAPSSLNDFAKNHSFKRITEAKELLFKHIHNHSLIALYGDYDADGIMGTSIMAKTLKMINYSHFIYYIPSRYLDGYGLTIKKSEEWIKKGVSLVITIDNGISANEPISLLRKNNVDVLILDHHQLPNELPAANVILHPQYSEFGETPSSGAFTSFMFSREVLGYYDKYLSTLASISLISDMMPIKDYNRRLLKACFANYRIGEFLPLDLLTDYEKLDETVIGIKLAPRINSIGRMVEDSSINQLIPYFIDDNKEYCLTYITYILKTNEERKEYGKQNLNDFVFNNDDSGIVVVTSLKEGMVGLAASSLCNKYHRPVIAFTDVEDGILKGSGRSPEGFNLFEAFNQLSNYFITFGGHASAGGCSIKKEQLDSFKIDFNQICSTFEEVEPKTIEISLADINAENYQTLMALSPFGEGFKSPLFKINRIRTSSLMFSKDQKHILTIIGLGKKIIGFNMLKTEVTSYNFIDICGTLNRSVYHNNVTYEFLIKSYSPSKE